MTWELFVGLFHVDIPIWTLVGVSAFVFLGSAIVWVLCDTCHRRNRIVVIWTAACIFLMLWIKVLSRLSIWDNGLPWSERAFCYDLMPLWSIQYIKDGYVEIIYEKVNNVILFTPLGVLLSCFKSQASGFKRLQKALLYGMSISITIELLQLLTRTGMCETDDVICNTLGCVIGYGLATVIWGSFKWIKNKLL